MESFTLVDAGVALIIVVSAILAYSRGLVREILAIAGWIVAAIVAFVLAPTVQPLVAEIPYLDRILGDSCELTIIAAFAGNQPRPSAKTTVRKIAMATSGVDVVRTDMKVTERSWTEPSFIPAAMPKISAMGIISAKTQNPNMPVLTSFSPINSPTGPFFSKE